MATTMTNEDLIKPWYKQFWPWFIMVPPATAVVAGIITVIIAFENADSLVVDDYYKSGLAINDRIHQQKNAAILGYAATLNRLPDNRLFLKFDNASPDLESVKLLWSHPFDAKKDFIILLNRQLDGSFQSKSENNLDGRWYLRLSNDEWLLKAEIIPGKNVVHLTPQLN